MRLDKKELSNCSMIMNKEQLRLVGHMNKRTVTYLLENEFIPSIYDYHSNRYTIKKSDVIHFFNDYYRHPDKYNNLPDGRKLRVDPGVRNPNKLRTYYKKKLSKFDKDVLTVPEIATITGYGFSTIRKWIQTGRLESLVLPKKLLVPKEILIGWLISEEYNSIVRKSDKHLAALLKS